MASIADPKIFHGQESKVEIGDALSTIVADEPLDTQMSSATEFSGVIKDITITDPEASVEVQNTFGGQIKAESPYDLVTIDFTMRFRDIQAFEQMHGDGSTYSTNSETWTRVSGGATIGSRPNKSVLFHLEKELGGTTYKMNYLINNAYFQQMGEISQDAEGDAEVTGTAVALVEDREVEKNF